MFDATSKTRVVLVWGELGLLTYNTYGEFIISIGGERYYISSVDDGESVQDMSIEDLGVL